MFFITGLTPRDGGGDLEKLEINVYSASSIAGSSTGSGGWKCSSTAHISCLVESGEIDKVGNTKKAIVELVYNCPAYKDD